MSGHVGSVRGHRTFSGLTRSRHRASAGPIRVSFSPAEEDRTGISVAYAIGRRVGGAVVRNRCRRRMRSIVAEVADQLPSGSYLISVGPEMVQLKFEELRERLVEVMRNASRSR